MSLSKEIQVGDITIGGDSPLVLIAGPCVIESEELALNTGREMKCLCEKLGVPYIFKSSYLKDNRTSIHSFTGPGVVEGMGILRRVKETLDVPVLSDIHSVNHIPLAEKVLDVIQIPSFLCKQTSLITEAAKTGKPINVKKGQFLAPSNIRFVIDKITTQGNENILLTERGTCFGYFDIINDFRSLPIKRSYGYPVVYDATNSIRTMGLQSSEREGGHPEFVAYLTRAAVAAGCDALFIEVHPAPGEALCDASSQFALDQVETLVKEAKLLHQFVRRELSVLPKVV